MFNKQHVNNKLNNPSFTKDGFCYNEIKNIIFDLGGVVLEIDVNLTRHAFEKLGFSSMDVTFSKLKSENIIYKFETGHISQLEFYEALKRASNLNLDFQQVENAWNAMILDFPSKRIALLRKLKENKQTFLLSNTNETHLKRYSALFKEQHGEDLDSLFKKAYYSHLLGLRKPLPEIFEYVLKKEGLVPKETLFIDDLAENIETANKLGIQTHLLLPKENLNTIFN